MNFRTAFSNFEAASRRVNDVVPALVAIFSKITTVADAERVLAAVENSDIAGKMNAAARALDAIGIEARKIERAAR